MTVPVYWLTRREEIQSSGPWDTEILNQMFDGQLWPHPWLFDHHVNVPHVEENTDHAVVVLPARHYISPEDLIWVNEELRKIRASILILVGDEESVFPWRDVKQAHTRFWVQLPDPDVHGDMKSWAFFFGDGAPPGTSEHWRDKPLPLRNLGWSFSGQVTHKRRKQAVAGMRKCRTIGQVVKSEGFALGLEREHYLDLLGYSKVAPAPAGSFTPDTFRFFEAVEAGALPIPDRNSEIKPGDYWNFAYPESHPLPFPLVDDWDTAGGLIEDGVRSYPAPQNRVQAWWVAQKRNMVEQLNGDLLGIGAKPDFPRHFDQRTTIVVTASPIPSHPSIDMLRRTVESAWESMGTTVPVIVGFDGVRTEQAAMLPSYEKAIQQVCWDSLHRTGWAGNVMPMISNLHLHQAKMTRLILDEVVTPTIVFMEHDTPFNDQLIDWHACIDLVEYRAIDVLRFHHEAQVLPVHQHLMLDEDTVNMLGVPLRRTLQWSQRPQLAGAEYYRKMLDGPWFHKPNNGFIEDTMHGIVQSNGGGNRVAIYHPEGSICRTLHLDGRANGPKYDGSQP